MTNKRLDVCLSSCIIPITYLTYEDIMKRICKECYYYRRPPTGLSEKDYATCDATKTLNLVTGEWEYNFCWIERESLRPEACGVDAKLYEEPEPREMWQRDEPQGVTNWDTGWNGVYAEENQNG